MRPLAFLAISSLLGSLAAQVPLDYVLVVESNKGQSLRYVEPSTGVSTVVLSRSSPPLQLMATTAALDPTDPTSIYFAGGLSSVSSALVRRATLQGNLLQSATNVVLTGIVGAPVRLHVLGTDMLLTVGVGSAPGLYRGPLAGGAATKLVALPSASDIAVIGTKVYVSSYLAANPTTIIEYDTVSQTSRVVGTAYPTIKAIAAFSSLLMAGTDNGDLLLIDPMTGGSAVYLSPGKGPITAVVTTPATGLTYFSAGSSVWSVASLGTPIYSGASALYDLEIGVHAQASQLVFGQGCAGGNVTVPYVDPFSLPSLGNASFGLRIANATPAKPAVLVLGQSRTHFGTIPLPLDLTVLGMPGCFLYTDELVTLGALVTASGVAQVPVPIPNLPFLYGGHLTGQFIVLDAQSLPLGLALSEGTEGIVR